MGILLVLARGACPRGPSVEGRPAGCRSSIEATGGETTRGPLPRTGVCGGLGGRSSSFVVNGTIAPDDGGIVHVLSAFRGLVRMASPFFSLRVLYAADRWSNRRGNSVRDICGAYMAKGSGPVRREPLPLHGVLANAGRAGTDAEALAELTEAGDVLLGQVLQQTAALADQDQQTPTGVVVVLVGLEVLGQVRDPAGQQSDLHLGGAGVALLGAELGDDLLLRLDVERHTDSLGVCGLRAPPVFIAGKSQVTREARPRGEYTRVTVTQSTSPDRRTYPRVI